MAIQIKSDGSFSIEYEGPYQGIDVQHPETLISDKATFLMQNFMLRNAELRSRPQFVQGIPAPAVDYTLNKIQGETSFLDINGNYHTVTWINNQLFQYRSLTNDWVAIPGTQPNGNQLMAYRVFANNIYYTNISVFLGSTFPFLAYWDGIAATAFVQQTFSDASTSNSIAGISKTDSPTVGGSLPGAPTVVGPLSIGSQFIGELNNQLILANISVLDQGTGLGVVYGFPNLMWWSANGLPKQWDPTQNTSAGFNAFLDVSDQITGLTTMGIAGYLFRTYGITQFTPTGSAVTPFEFDHMWASERGIGNVLPWSIAQYGPTAAFVAQDNIYTLSVTSSTPIGGNARDAIYADLANASGTPLANIIPIFKAGYVYLIYQISMTLTSGGTQFTRFYQYSFEEKNWSNWDTVFVLSARPNTV